MSAGMFMRSIRAFGTKPSTTRAGDLTRTVFEIISETAWTLSTLWNTALVPAGTPLFPRKIGDAGMHRFTMTALAAFETDLMQDPDELKPIVMDK
jgi:hypothetical protein